MIVVSIYESGVTTLIGFAREIMNIPHIQLTQAQDLYINSFPHNDDDGAWWLYLVYDGEHIDSIATSRDRSAVHRRVTLTGHWLSYAEFATQPTVD